MQSKSQKNMVSISIYYDTDETVDFTRMQMWHYYRPRGKFSEKFMMGKYVIKDDDTMYLTAPKGERLPKAVADFAILIGLKPIRIPKRTFARVCKELDEKEPFPDD